MKDSDFPPSVHFDFPLAHPRYGVSMGNDKLEISVWGDALLCLTIGRAREDARCENEISENELRALFEAGDVAGVCERLANAFDSHSADRAHLELHFAGEIRPIAATFQPDGILQIALNDGKMIALECAMDEEVAWLEEVAGAQWQLSLERPGNADDSAPLEIEIDDGRGFIWEAPGENSAVVMVREREQQLFIATAAGEVEDAAKAAVSRARQKPDINPIYYWKQYWRAAPRVAWPNAQLQKQWNIALFKQAQAGATTNFVAAFSAFLARTQGDEIHILPDIPRGWSELSFDNVRCENGFILGADLKAGVVSEVRVWSENGGLLRLYPNAKTRVERAMAAGETWIWRAD